jgi:TolA-binding protein
MDALSEDSERLTSMEERIKRHMDTLVQELKTRIYHVTQELTSLNGQITSLQIQISRLEKDGDAHHRPEHARHTSSFQSSSNEDRGLASTVSTGSGPRLVDGFDFGAPWNPRVAQRAKQLGHKLPSTPQFVGNGK